MRRWHIFFCFYFAVSEIEDGQLVGRAFIQNSWKNYLSQKYIWMCVCAPESEWVNERKRGKQANKNKCHVKIFKTKIDEQFRLHMFQHGICIPISFAIKHLFKFNVLIRWYARGEREGRQAWASVIQCNGKSWKMNWNELKWNVQITIFLWILLGWC